MSPSRARYLRGVSSAAMLLGSLAASNAVAGESYYNQGGSYYGGPSSTGLVGLEAANKSGIHTGLGVRRRSYDSPSLLGHCEDPHSLETRRRWGRVSENQYHYDPYGYRDDLGFYARSYMDRDGGSSTRTPVSSDVSCLLSDDVSAPGPGYRSGVPGVPGVSGGTSSISSSYDPDFSFDKELAEIYEASGWTPLSDGRTDDALRRFAELARRNPERGVPRVGLALATAELGDLDRGTELMREALRIDGESLYDVPVDTRLRARLISLGRHYPATEFSQDIHFMRAALRYLVAQNDAAHTAIERAVARGDDSESTATLRRMILERPRPSRVALSPGSGSR